MEIPDDISQASVSVLQAGDSLSEDGSRAGCWPLATLNTPVKVQIADSSVNHQFNVPVGNGKWLLFKLSGRGLGQGRMVKHVSSGSYLAIVPETWQRDAQKAGSPPTTPESVFLEVYRAHFFELTESASSCIAFRDELGQSITIGSSGARFHLIGHEIHDDRELVGPLFGGEPPRLGIENGHWSDVQTIVVGQEGSGRQRWRKRFEPKADRPQQELPHEVLGRKVGWYFIRFYDSTDTLIDSLDFRFVAGLKKISIPMSRPVPSPEGHVAQTVEIVHDSGYRIKLVEGCPGLKVVYGSEKTILRIPPGADCDRTRWVIQPPNNDGQEVELAILIERVWWTLGSNDTEPLQWGDRLVSLSRGDFTAASDRAVWMRLPKPRWASAAYAGFRRESARCFPIKVTDKTVRIPLRDFSGAQELDDQGVGHQFKIWLKVGQSEYEVTIAKLRSQANRENLEAAQSTHEVIIAELPAQANSETRGPMKQIIRMKMESYDPRVLDNFVKRLIDFAKENNVIVKGPVPLPTKIERYTVIRSPHIHKNSREQFEIRRHKRMIDIVDPQPRLLDEMNNKISIPSSIGMRIQVLNKEGD